MRNILAAAVIAASILSTPAAVFAHEGKSKGVTVSHPWVRASPGGSTLTAAFMEIKAEADDKLLGAATPAAGRAEVHTHIHEGGVMKMRRVDALAIPAGQPVVLKPMGDHIMMMDLKAPLKEGDLIKLTLTFEKAGAIEVEATVEPVGAMGPHGENKQPNADDQKTGGDHQHH